jgi:hypothetical protein
MTLTRGTVLKWRSVLLTASANISRRVAVALAERRDFDAALASDVADLESLAAEMEAASRGLPGTGEWPAIKG